MGSEHYSEIILQPSHTAPNTIEMRRVSTYKYTNSDHGALMSLLRKDEQKEQRKIMSSVYVLDSGKSVGDTCGGLMNTPLDECGGLSPVDYATNVCGIYAWLSQQDTKDGIDKESVRFITYGQKAMGRGHHNAVLMRNPKRVVFPNNTCPYNERFNRGLTALSKTTCEKLGIKYVLLIDEVLSREDAMNIEKGCHYEINHLALGQRLHRTPGAGGVPEKDGVRTVIGLTILPPNFFEDNPDICIVASAR